MDPRLKQFIEWQYTEPQEILSLPFIRARDDLDDCQVATCGNALMAYRESGVHLLWSPPGEEAWARHLLGRAVRSQGPRFTVIHERYLHPSLWAMGFQVKGQFFRARYSGRRERPVLPPGYELADWRADERAVDLINLCYEGLRIGLAYLQGLEAWEAHFPGGWFGVLWKDVLAGLSICHYDPARQEGFLDWIQVHPGHRRRGVGRFLVLESVRRLAERTDLITVAGDSRSSFRVADLYRACGFRRFVDWYLLVP